MDKNYKILFLSLRSGPYNYFGPKKKTNNLIEKKPFCIKS